MIFDGEKKVYILSEQEYDEMFDGKAHANLELIKVRKQLENKLKIATDTLEDLELSNDIRICMKAHEALTKMEGVK